jgi:hypothetical protein
MYDDTHAAWEYTGNWLTYNGSGPYADTLHYTDTANSTATFVFQGPARFVLYYSKMSNRGSFEVWVDGTLLTTIDAYSSSALWQQTYTSPMYSDGDSHIVVIKKVGSGRGDVDAIQISADFIFSDGFESRDFSSWTSNWTDDGDLSVSAAAKYQGDFGMEALIDDTGSIYVYDDTPRAEKGYRARFYFDPNSLVMSSGDHHTIFDGQDTATTAQIFTVGMNYDNGDYRLYASARRDNYSWGYTGYHTISDDWHVLEIEWQAASAAGANDGYLKLWIDDTLVDTISSVDNDTYSTGQIKLGATSGVDAGTSGTIYFDAFESRRETFIGPLAGMPILARVKSIVWLLGQKFLPPLQ